MSDFGDYTCMASNDGGASWTNFQITLSPAQPPDEPLNCHKTHVDLDQLSLSFSCVAGFDGGAPQKVRNNQRRKGGRNFFMIRNLFCAHLTEAERRTSAAAVRPFGPSGLRLVTYKMNFEISRQPVYFHSCIRAFIKAWMKGKLLKLEWTIW